MSDCVLENDTTLGVHERCPLRPRGNYGPPFYGRAMGYGHPSFYRHHRRLGVHPAVQDQQYATDNRQHDSTKEAFLKQDANFIE